MQAALRSLKWVGRLAMMALLALGVAQAQDATAISVDSFTSDFSAVEQLSDVVAQGSGAIAVLLPETTTSARYTAFDEPFLRQALQAAGLADSDIIVNNAQGSESTQLTQAEAAITQGAVVLLLDPISSGVGASIEQYATERGVAVIDYDRLTLGGARSHYVSFDNPAGG